MDGYEQIYSRMKERYEEKTGAKIDEASDLGIRFSVLASEVYSILCGCEWIKRQMFPDTCGYGRFDKRYRADKVCHNRKMCH